MTVEIEYNDPEIAKNDTCTLFILHFTSMLQFVLYNFEISLGNRYTSISFIGYRTYTERTTLHFFYQLLFLLTFLTKNKKEGPCNKFYSLAID